MLELRGSVDAMAGSLESGLAVIGSTLVNLSGKVESGLSTLHVALEAFQETFSGEGKLY